MKIWTGPEGLFAWGAGNVRDATPEEEEAWAYLFRHLLPPARVVKNDDGTISYIWEAGSRWA